MRNIMKSTDRICHLTVVHKPEDVRIFQKECFSLSKKGYQVFLIAPCSGEYSRKDVNFIPLQVPGGRLRRVTTAPFITFIKALKVHAKIYHFHDPELILTGFLLKLSGKKVVYDVHEDYRQQIKTKYWIPRFSRSIISSIFGIIESLASEFFDGIVTATPYIGSKFPTSKTEVVQNFPIISEFGNPKFRNNESKKGFVYIGSISAIRGLSEMLRALEKLPENMAYPLLLAGDFQPGELRKQIRNLEKRNRVEYLGFLSRQEIAELLEKAIAGIVLLHPVPNYIDSYPVKMFEYMAAGIPVIASDFPLWRSIIEDNNCGICVDPLNIDQISETMIWMMEHPDEAKEMGENGRKAVLEKYNWEQESRKLLALYDKLLKK